MVHNICNMSTKFLVTKVFTKGLLKGLTITEETGVAFVVGKTYKACVGSSVYKVIGCEAVK